jgi:site-specific DNA-methyltransferase (adenine-specific)
MGLAPSKGSRAMITLSTSNALAAEKSSRRSHEAPDFIGDAMLGRATTIPNVVQRGDALTLLRSLPDGCTPLMFFDPQHRAVLDKLKFGNEGARQRGRAELPAMSESYIDDCCREGVRVLAPSGYLMRWVDTYTLLQDWHLRIADLYQPVDLIAWDSLRIGNGYRSRRRGDYLVILQKPPIRAKSTWRDHGIPSRWPEKVDRNIHPHIKPIGLITRLIAAVTQPGDVVVDPAAGSFVVMRAAHRLGRNFIGCDLRIPPPLEAAR